MQVVVAKTRTTMLIARVYPYNTTTTPFNIFDDPTHTQQYKTNYLNSKVSI
jgi:hypothetical protein